MKYAMRIGAALMALVMMLSLFSACTAPVEQPAPAPAPTPDATVNTMANGNINTAPAEDGTEEELTAVREKLIKKSEIEGLGEITKMEFYENGVRVKHDNYVQARDNKKFYYSGDIKRVVNYTDGYILDMPQDWAPDFTMSSARSVYRNADVTLIVSDEEEALGIYGGAQGYIDANFQFVNTDNYMAKNRVTKLAEETIQIDDEYSAFVLKLYLRECLEGTQCYYTYVVVYNDLKLTHMMFKCVDDRDLSSVYLTYQGIFDKGSAVDTIAYPEGDNPSWTAETKALYDSLMNTDKVQWGLVNGNIDENPLKLKYPAIEKRVDFKFPIVTTYTDQLTYDFPVEQARKITADGRYIQFTYHYDYAYGNRMGQNAPILDVYRGELDEEFREFAKQVVEYGQPMLFRLNNEMNSDWTSWAAVNAMLDPDIFTATWIRMYQIFEEEGANKYLIWVWNPQGSSTAPVTNWNETLTYMPGAKYVDMLGITAYNFGDENVWYSFETLYEGVEIAFKPHFGDWAWIISEFGCSDATDDETRKAQWITDMFDCFDAGKFPNIKAAVWFNGNDYDGSGNITHEIALGRDPEAIAAFKEGLAR